MSYNAIDRHVATNGDAIALRWESDEPGTGRSVTFRELQSEVSRIANAMKAQGVKKGDVVTVYMPMIPELPMVMLACARIGAVHSVVFAGFSANALRDRITDCNSKWVFTSDEGKRGGKAIKLKDAVDAAVDQCPEVNKVFTFKYTGGQVKTNPKDVWMHDILPSASTECPPEPMDSHDPLFVLYTSGSTGKPKGVVHATGGYSVYAAMTAKNTFDLRKDDVFCCVADCGWVTGHTYVVYGPLLNGVTSVMFESVPTYPNPYRYWDLVQRVKATQFYAAPTAIRTLMRYCEKQIKDYDLSSLRVLGSVGEPINPEAWKWFYDNVGHEKCTIVDTYWQTETGGHIVTNLPGAAPMKPGACVNPYFGVNLAVLDAVTGKEIEGNDVEGVLAIKSPWPGMAQTIFGDHERFQNTYMNLYKGYYFTGDACRRDHDGSYWITGRVDDVINCSGHRIGKITLFITPSI
jgi:acetyl-CoA synthetase